MASIHLQGTLVDSLGEIDVGAIMTFTHLTATGETIPTTKVDLIIPPNGFYSIDVEYGQIRIDYTTRFTQRFIATVIVNQDSTATSIPELLNAAVPVTPPVILEMQDILADAVAAANTSEAFADQLTTVDLIGSTTVFAPDTNFRTKGYLTSGDGGAGHWVQNGQTAQPISKSPAQLGDALLNDGNGNQWSLVPLSGTANAEVQASSLGVFPDADKSLELQACLYAAEFGGGASGGGIVVLGKGQFIAKELIWPSRVTINGGGRTTTTLKLADASDSYLLASRTYVNNQTFVDTRHQASGITFDGNKANQTSGNGLIIIKSYRSKFEDVAVNNAYSSAIRLTARTANGTATSSDQAENNFTGSYFNQNGGPGIFGDDDNLGVIADGHIQNCVFNANSLNEKLADVQIDRAAGWKILDNQLYGGGFHCISVKNLARTVITGNHLDLDATLAVGGDKPSAINIVSFSSQAVNTISNNPIFLDHDGNTSGATPRAFLIESSSNDALSLNNNPCFSNGTNDQAYEYTPVTKMIDATINNPVDSNLLIGDKPSDICDNWSNNEVGVFTPTASFSTLGDFVPTYTVQDGNYTRIGNVVYFNAGVTINTNAYTTTSGDFAISGLPYTASAEGSFYQQTVTVGPFDNVTIGDTRTLSAYVTNNAIGFRRSASGSTHGSLSVSNVLPSTNNISFNISGFYLV